MGSPVISSAEKVAPWRRDAREPDKEETEWFNEEDEVLFIDVFKKKEHRFAGGRKMWLEKSADIVALGTEAFLGSPSRLM